MKVRTRSTPVLRVLILVVGLSGTHNSWGAESSAPEDRAPISFLKDVAPVLIRNCVGCHNAKRSEGKYDLTTFENLIRGRPRGEGAIVEPGKPGESRLVELIRHDGEPRMPFKQDPLPLDSVALIERWVAEGAVYDGPDRSEDWLTLLHRRRATAAPESYKMPVPISAVAFSPDGAAVAASGLHEVTVWSLSDGSLRHRIASLAERVHAISYSPDGRWLATADGDPGRAGSVKLWQAQRDGNASSPRELFTGTDAVLSLVFSPDSSRLAAAGTDRNIRVWEVASGRLLRSIEDHADWILDLAFSPDGKRVATASRDRTAKVFEVDSGQALATFSGHAESVNAVAFHPGGRLIATGGSDNQVRVWDPDDDAKQRASFSGFAGPVLRVRYLPGTGGLLASGADRTVRLFSEESQAAVLERHDDWVGSLAVSPEGSAVVSGSWDGGLRHWKLPDGKPGLSITAAPGLVRGQQSNK